MGVAKFSTGVVLRFGGCEVHLDAREVWRCGQRQAVRRQVFELVVALARAAPRVVPHRELALAISGRSELPRGLVARAVVEARRALGDNLHDPAILTSVRGVGYRCAEMVAVVAPGVQGLPHIPGPVRPAGPGTLESASGVAQALSLLQQACTLLAEVQATQAAQAVAQQERLPP